MTQKKLIALMMASFGLGACSKEGMDSSKPHFSTGVLIYRGHEDLTAIAIKNANQIIKEQHGIETFFPAAAMEEGAIFSENPVIIGNFRTDFPTSEFAKRYGVDLEVPDSFDSIEAFYQAAESFQAWHHAPEIQHLHALRDFRQDGSVASASETCHQVQNTITTVTIEAVNTFKSNRQDTNALLLTGHATHMIQDSFSAAHTKRTGEAGINLEDHCSYGPEVPGVCHHEENDSRDQIYKSPWCSVVASDDCLIPEAQNAIRATTSYLVWLANAVTRQSTPVDSFSAWLNGDEEIKDSGYFRCNQ